MVVFRDRTVVGTIRGCLAELEEPYVGPRGPARLARSHDELEAFVTGAARLELPGLHDSDRFLSALQEALSFALGERPGRLQMDVCQARSYRKQTHLSQVDRDGRPWLILKAFAEPCIGHQILRAYREVDGTRALLSIEGVAAPEVVDVFAVSGPGLPARVLLVAESFLPGRTLLQRLWEAPSPRKLSDETLATLRRCGGLLARIHAATRAGNGGCVDGMLEEVSGFATGLADAGVIGAGDGAKVMALLERRLPSVTGRGTVLAHRDYTIGNLLVGDEGEVSLVDLEKSDREYPAKDVAKFTETLHIDAVQMGYSLEQEARLREAFLDGYGASPAEEESIRFYQLYTALALMRYHVQRGTERSVGLLVERVRSLLA